MSRTSLYSLHNDLDVGRGELLHVQLNPAVVLSESEEAFTLSIVCIGPRLADEDSITLELIADDESIRCESIHCRSEDSGSDLCLTVAIFPATRELLERLAVESAVTVSLESDRRRSLHSLSDENRRNVMRFLDEAGRHVAAPWSERKSAPVAV